MSQYTYGLTRLLGHGHAFSEVVPVPSPAAATGFTYTVGNKYWELLDSLSFRLVTDANAADRQVTVTVNDGSGVPLGTFPAASTQAASLTYDYSFLGSLSTFNAVVALAVTGPLYQGMLQPTFTVTVTVGSVQAGDQISRVRLNVERFVTGPQGYLLGVQDDKQVAGFRDVPLVAAVS